MTGIGLGGMILPNHGSIGNGITESGLGGTGMRSLGRVGMRVT